MYHRERIFFINPQLQYSQEGGEKSWCGVAQYGAAWLSWQRVDLL
jgi:hypothetical protein